MTEREIKQDILRVCKVAGHDSDFNVIGFHALCDRLKQLGAEAERRKAQDEIDTLYEMYKLVCSQRDELMDQQRAQIAALRGRIQ